MMSSSQCYNYTTIDDPTRSVNQNSSSTCDSTFFSSGQTWVRFVGTGGTQIPTSAVGPNRCGTQATGWYSGEMPNVLDSTTNGTVCFEWQTNTCNWNTNALVTNCGSYYVYRLTAPSSCNLRYCTDTPSNPIPTTTESNLSYHIR
jgi:hypothetical protein